MRLQQITMPARIAIDLSVVWNRPFHGRIHIAPCFSNVVGVADEPNFARLSALDLLAQLLHERHASRGYGLLVDVEANEQRFRHRAGSFGIGNV